MARELYGGVSYRAVVTGLPMKNFNGCPRLGLNVVARIPIRRLIAACSSRFCDLKRMSDAASVINLTFAMPRVHDASCLTAGKMRSRRSLEKRIFLGRLKGIMATVGQIFR